jgi:diguanylate cyclase (GGDEF)-like protein
VALALTVGSFADGPREIVVALLAVAALQPVLPLFWTSQGAYRQAQVVSDVVVFAAVVVLMPDYYWLSSIVLVAIVANHAVLSPIKHYVLASVLTVGAMATTGALLDIDQWRRAVAISIILAAGLGYLGHRTRTSMRESRSDLLHALGAAGGLAHLTDLHHGVVDVVGDVPGVVGWSRDEWLAMDHRDVMHPDDVGDYWIDPDAVAPGELIDRVVRLRTAEGGWIWMRDVSRVVMHRKRPHIRGFSIDVTAQQVGLVQVRTEALTDQLTGLPNRRALLNELEDRAHLSGHHLVLIDLDRFKDVNDTLGHESGDALLTVVAQRLSRCLRTDDVLARLGGDEFAVVIGGAGADEHVQATIDRIALEVAQPVEIAGVNLSSRFSAGIVAARLGESDASTMLRRADIAMYAAKRRNEGAVLFDDALEHAAERRAALSNSLPDALASGALRLDYQPIFDAATGRVVSGEGLARWDHPTYGLIGPDVFLDVVLMSDRSGDFTRSMVADAIATVPMLTGADSDATVAVNLPIRTLEDPGFASWFDDACRTADVEPDRLVFEIAEGDIHDARPITVAIDRLVELGVRISVDDFGAGHATFERLRWRNVAQLKLDRSLLLNATVDARARAVLSSIVALSQELGYELVAEGVEEPAQHELLRELGCPFVQGFLFSGVLRRSDFVAVAAGATAGSIGWGNPEPSASAV